MADAKKYALIDLHIHLDGSISLQTAKALAKMQGIELCSNEELAKKLQVSEDCRDLCEYLEKFDFPLSLLQTREAITKAVFGLCEELREQGLVYAEIRFAPQLHLTRGLSQEAVVEAAIDGMKQSKMLATLILCCMRGEDNHEQNITTVEVAKKFLGCGVGAVDLGGAEALYPNENFVEIFEYAREKGIPFTLHAGEAAGALSVRSAVAMGARRIGHGVRSVEDETLISELADSKIALELCPTSNLNTKVFDSLADYPIKRFLNAGVVVTVNTDNTIVSNTTLVKEFEKLDAIFDFSDDELCTIVKNAVSASFATDDVKEKVFSLACERLSKFE